MKILTLLTKSCLLALVGSALLTLSARADAVYFVDINTTELVANSAGPFYLDFQLTYGSGSGNTAILSDFKFTGGSPVAGTESSVGNVSGALPGTLVLNNSTDFLNEYFQQFSTGTTDIRFKLDLSAHLTGANPDGFNVAILDHDLFNLPTTDASGGDQLLSASINGGVSFVSAVTTGKTGGVSAAVPDSSGPLTNLSLLGLLLVGCALIGRRQRVLVWLP